MKNITSIVAIALALIGLSAPATRAHDPGNPFPDIEIHRNGSNRLVATYPFDRTPIVAVTDTGFAGVYSALDPGFIPGETNAGSGLFALTLATAVGIEILAVEPGLQLRINGTTLDGPAETALIGTHDDANRGASDLHQHGEFQLAIDPSGERAFAEGEIHFRLYDAGATYTPSAPRSLTVSNGYLPTAGVPSNDSVKCFKTIAKEAGQLMRATRSGLAKCLAVADAVVNLGASANSVPKNCGLDAGQSNTMIGRIERARTKAFSKIDRSCGPLSSASVPVTLAAVQAHLDMYRCRGEEVVAATYNNARDLITGAIESALFASACVANVCVGGIADGAACTATAQCETKTLVTAATVCMHESAVSE